VAGVLVTAGSVAAQGKPRAQAATLTKVTSVEGITEYSMPNGLRVLLFPDASKPTATVNITYLVGSRNEGYGETGMAHLLEHMVFKGTPKHPDIPSELSQHGADPNGTTWLDRTNYFETFSATAANLEWALDLEADRMVHSYIAKKALDTEFSVVRNEFESGENSPQNVLLERVQSTAFLWHNYGHSTIGARSDIEQVPIERLQSFYHRYYQPDNAVLVVAGKIDPDKTLALIAKKFGAVPRPDRSGVLKIYPTYTAEPVQDGERSVTLRRVGDVQAAVALYHVPAGTHPDYAAVDVLTEVLGSAPSGRLYKALVETKQAAEVAAFSFQLKEPGALIALAQVRKEDPLETARATMLATIQQVVDSAPSAEEVERAKGTLLKNIDLNLTNSERIGLELSEWAAIGDWRMLFLHRDRIKGVTPADVKRVAAAYLKPSNLTVGLFIPTEKPDRAEIPLPVDVAALVKDYKGNPALAAGEVFAATPENIDARTTRTTLPGGLQLALLPKKTRGAVVAANVVLRFGTLEAVMGKRAIGDLTGDMLLRGTASLTRQQIKDSLDKLKARVNVSGGFSNARLSIETTHENLVPTLRLVAAVVRNPSFPDAEFATLKQENISQLEQQKAEPVAQGAAAFQRMLSPYPDDDPRATLPVPARIAEYQAATLAEVKQFYTGFYGANHAQMAVVGDFDAAEVKSAAQELFGAWKSPAAFARIPQVRKEVPPADVKLETPDKANAFFIAGQSLGMRDDDPDYPAMVMADYIVGGGFLNSRLATRIRQKDGLSYGVGSQFQSSPQDSAGVFISYAIYAPQNLAKLETAFREEMDKARADGFTADEIEKAKQGLLQARDVDRAKDAYLASQLADQVFRGRTFAQDGKVDAALKSLTPAQVSAAFRKYVDPSKFVIVKAGDFNKKPAAPATP
jgi:zinc protease